MAEKLLYIDGTSALATDPRACRNGNKFGFDLGEIALAGQAIVSQTSLPSDREATVGEIQYQPNSFLQVTTRINPGKLGPDQAGFVSFGLAGGIETIFPVIRSIASELPKTSGGRLKVRGFGDKGIVDQITIFIEAKIGEIDPKDILKTAVLSPINVYDQQKGLKQQSEVQRMRWESMFGSGGKGDLHLGIVEGRIEGDVQAYQPDGTDHFAGGFKIVEGDQLAGKGMNGELQTLTSLAMHPKVSASMREKILAEQEWIAQTPEGMIRSAITINADETIECCRYSTGAMLEKVINFVKQGVDFVTETGNAIYEKAQTFAETLRSKVSSMFGGTGGTRYDSENCSSCGKNRSKEDGCKCSTAKS